MDTSHYCGLILWIFLCCALQEVTLQVSTSDHPSIEAVTNGRPTTIGNYIRLSKGDNLTLTCRGDGPVHWEWESHSPTNYMPSNKVEVLEENWDPGNQNNMHKRVLNIYNAQWFNARAYKCYFLPSESSEEDYSNFGLSMAVLPGMPDKETEVFIFVADDLEPFQDTKPRLPTMISGMPLDIPCGVTDPYLRVDLMANGLNKTAQEGVEWDPKRGFNVMNPNKDFLVNVYCRTVTSAGIEKTKQVRVHDYGSPVTPKPIIKSEKPTLKAFVNGNAVTSNETILLSKGDDLKVTCSGHQPVDWDWEPMATEPLPSNKLFVVDESEPAQDLYLKVLHILNVQLSNPKSYVCYVIDGTVNDVKLEVTIKDSEDQKEEEADGQPTIISLNDTVRLNKGDNFSVACKGNKPIDWTWTDGPYLEPVPGNQIDVTEENRELVNQHLKVLHIDNAQWFNTRAYKCVYTSALHQPNQYGHGFDFLGETPKKEDKESSSIFIFVADPDEPFQSTGLIFLALYYNKPLNIPCGVTDPYLKVDLIANGLNMTGQTGIEWDPKTGFKVLAPTYDFTNKVLCKTPVKNSENDGIKPINVLNLGGPDDLAPAPHLEVTKYSMIIGDTVTLKCWVKGVVNFVVYMSFDYQKKGVSGDNLH